MEKKEYSIELYEVDGLEDLSEVDRELVQMAREMTFRAYAPYSEFFVGAVVLLENGETVKGSNQENGAYPSGLCAERVAVFSASAQFPGVAMKTIAISARSDRLTSGVAVSPCGACRQVMLEYESFQQKPIKLLLSRENGKILVINKVQDLLPLAFTGNELKKHRKP